MAKKPTCQELEKRPKQLEQETAQRKRAEQALRKSEHYFRSLVTHMGDGLLVIDRDYRVADVNNS